MNSLVALGAGAAWSYSVVATFAPQWLPEAARNVYFEAAAVIVTLILLGRMLEARARATGAAIQRLIGLQPRTARVMRDGQPVDLPIEQVRKGEIVLVRRARRSRWTARSSKAIPTWTNPCSRASPCRSRRWPACRPPAAR